MQHSHTHHKTPAELQELCSSLNLIHRRLWTFVAGCVAVGAMIWNPYHLLTAALLLLFSRFEWEVKDIETLEK